MKYLISSSEAPLIMQVCVFGYIAKHTFGSRHNENYSQSRLLTNRVIRFVKPPYNFIGL